MSFIAFHPPRHAQPTPMYSDEKAEISSAGGQILALSDRGTTKTNDAVNAKEQHHKHGDYILWSLDLKHLYTFILLWFRRQWRKLQRWAGMDPGPEPEAIELLEQGRATIDDSVDQIVESVDGDANIGGGRPKTALDKYGTDLTAHAKDGKLVPIIGWNSETQRTIQMLSLANHYNPVIVGDAGTTKMAFFEGLAQRIVSDDVPDYLRGKRLIGLDASSLIESRGDFEKFLEKITQEMKGAIGREVILFISNMHVLLGFAGNALKSALLDHELKCCGETTFAGYREIEKNIFLRRMFKPVSICEPTVADTVSMLRGIKGKLEIRYGVRISDDALEAAASYSNKYITSEPLLEEASYLIEMAADALRQQHEMKPDALQRLEEHIEAMQFELVRAHKETGNPSKECCDVLEAASQEKQAELKLLTQAWQKERVQLAELRQGKEDLEAARQELERVKKEGNIDRGIELVDSTIPSLEQMSEEILTAAASQGQTLIPYYVSQKDIADIVSQ